MRTENGRKPYVDHITILANIVFILNNKTRKYKKKNPSSLRLPVSVDFLATFHSWLLFTRRVCCQEGLPYFLVQGKTKRNNPILSLLFFEVKYKVGVSHQIT